MVTCLSKEGLDGLWLMEMFIRPLTNFVFLVFLFFFNSPRYLARTLKGYHPEWVKRKNMTFYRVKTRQDVYLVTCLTNFAERFFLFMHCTQQVLRLWISIFSCLYRIFFKDFKTSGMIELINLPVRYQKLVCWLVGFAACQYSFALF